MRKKSVVLLLVFLLFSSAFLSSCKKTASIPIPTEKIDEPAEEEPTETIFTEDRSRVLKDDVTLTDVSSVEMDDALHLIAYKSDGSSVDIGYIGGRTIEGKYVVAFLDYDNSILKVELVKEGESAAAPGDPIRNGYAFYCWDRDFSDIKNDTAVVAQYVELGKYYTVQFKDFNGNTIKNEIVPAGEDAVPPEKMPLRKGYIFAGWEPDYTNVSQNIVVEPKYIDETSPHIRIEDVSSAVGGEAKVKVFVKNSPGICSANITVYFGPELTLTDFSFNEKQLGGIQTGPEKTPKSDSTTFQWMKYDTDVSGDFDYVTMKFKVSETAKKGNYPLELFFDPENICDTKENSVSFAAVPGTISVN